MYFANHSVIALTVFSLVAVTTATTCDSGSVYKGGDLLLVDSSYKAAMLVEMQNSEDERGYPNADEDNIYKSLFMCENGKLTLMHWCPYGIQDLFSGPEKIRTGETCLPQNTLAGSSKDMTSKGSILATSTLVAAAAVVFAITLA